MPSRSFVPLAPTHAAWARARVATDTAVLARAAPAVLGAALVALAGCAVRDAPRDGGAGGGSDGTSTGGAIRIDPADHVATLALGTPVVVDYRAFLRAPDGSERDVTAEVEWASSLPALGGFAGPRFTSAADRGGITTITARMGAAIGYTSLTISLTRVFIADGAPDDAPSRFGGAVDPGFSPELVYPEDATVVPPNLGELELHYRTGGATLFELHATTPSADLLVYFGCPEAVGGGCIYTPDREVWETFATAAAGRGPVTYTLRGTDGSGRVSATVSRTLRVAAEPITGGLYYWNAGAGTIDRFEFGVRGARAETYIGRSRTGAAMCVGCHALSRDGRRISVGSDTPTETIHVFDVATRAEVWRSGMPAPPLVPSPTEPNFVAWESTGAWLVGSGIDGLTIRDGNTGIRVAGPMGGRASEMPDVSPDGDHIVYVRTDPGSIVFPGLVDLSSVSSGRIARLDWDGTAWVEAPAELVANSGNNYYPTYSPDGDWIVYNHSPSNTPSMGMDPSSAMTAYVADAQMWVIRADGTGGGIRLVRAGGLADAWPKFDPTEYVSEGRPLYWLAWSSRRAFGLRYDESGPHAPQLWMAAFDPTEAAAGREPAAPAFRLPFQEIATGNHIAQWVTRVERMSCTTDAECSGEFCVDGRCYEEPPAPF